MKVFYYNDTSEAIHVKVIHFRGKSTRHIIGPQGQFITDLNVPEEEGVSPFIKRWKEGILITYVRIGEEDAE